jgi:hypothetical protein
VLARDKTYGAHSSDEGTNILFKRAEQTMNGIIHEDDKASIHNTKNEVLINNRGQIQPRLQNAHSAQTSASSINNKHF